MKRRQFNNLVAVSAAAAVMGAGKARAADASQLQSTLTPFGSERAGNAAGTIPPWTGGMTEIPAGFSWDPSRELPPDFFASDAMLYEVNQSNMSQYSHLLSEGLQGLIQARGFSLQVYTTRRTAAAPQWVYDNIARNVTRASWESGGCRLGVIGAYGGVPFPIPDTSDPVLAGAQIAWNHQSRWQGPYCTQKICSFISSDGQITQGAANLNQFIHPYYFKDGDPETFNGYLYKVRSTTFAPAVIVGTDLISCNSVLDPIKVPPITWQMLAGQGRVRKAPEVEYDTPSSYANGIINYDEYFGWNGAQDRYDFKLVGKQEMLIPYNNNKTLQIPVAEQILPEFYSPKAIRWELHRVWVVEMTLHPGERNVLARRRLYVDEDTWTAGVVDAWDSKNSLIRASYLPNVNFPNLPGTIFANTILYNPQTGDYVSQIGSYGEAPYNMPWNFDPISESDFNPQSMAASAAY